MTFMLNAGSLRLLQLPVLVLKLSEWQIQSANAWRPSAPAGYIELLRGNRSFRQLWLGQVVSQMGDWFDTIALYTIILNLTGSGRALDCC